MNNYLSSEATMTTTVVVNVESHKRLKKLLIDKEMTFSEWVRNEMEEKLSDEPTHGK